MEIGSQVQWKLAGRGNGRIATGKLLGVVPAGGDAMSIAGNLAQGHTVAFDRKNTVRDFDRYLISVPTGKGGAAKPKAVLAKKEQVIE